MFDPKITPKDISLDFFNNPITATVNSGNAELNPINIDPINDWSIPYYLKDLLC